MAPKTNLERIKELEEEVATLRAEITTLKENPREAETETSDSTPSSELQEMAENNREAIRLLAESTKTMNPNHTEILSLIG